MCLRDLQVIVNQIKSIYQYESFTTMFIAYKQSKHENITLRYIYIYTHHKYRHIMHHPRSLFRFISPKIRRAVKSHGQHAYLQKQLNLLETNSMQTLHFRLKFFAANFIFPCIKMNT